MAYAMTALQEKTQWCWAAVAYNVNHYYSAASPWTQCTIVQAVQNREPCCLDPSGFDECNQPNYLDLALKAVGCPYRTETGALSFEAVETEIAAGRPVCAWIQWPDQTGHYVIVAGCRTMTSGEREVWVLDPRIGPFFHDYKAFCTAYRSSGEWKGSCLMS